LSLMRQFDDLTRIAPIAQLFGVQWMDWPCGQNARLEGHKLAESVSAGGVRFAVTEGRRLGAHPWGQCAFRAPASDVSVDATAGEHNKRHGENAVALVTR
jgi:hypothetical protein